MATVQDYDSKIKELNTEKNKLSKLIKETEQLKREYEGLISNGKTYSALRKKELEKVEQFKESYILKLKHLGEDEQRLNNKELELRQREEKLKNIELMGRSD